MRTPAPSPPMASASRRSTGRSSEPCPVGPSDQARRGQTSGVGLVARWSVVAVLVVLCGACSSDNVETPPRTDSRAEKSKTGKMSPTAEAVDEMTGGRTVGVTTDTLPPPPEGFTAEELRAFADRAIDIAQRGASPKLQGKTPTEAFDYVFANQFPATTQAARAGSVAAAGSFDWEWSWASLFKAQPREAAKVLAARWQVDTVPGTLDDGTDAPQLQVTLSTVVEHLVPSQAGMGKGTAEPVVMQRAVTVQGYKPLGGSTFWPGIGVQTTPLLGGKCAPVNGSILTAAEDPGTVRKDLKALRDFLRTPERVNAESSTTGGDLADSVKRYCDQ